MVEYLLSVIDFSKNRAGLQEYYDSLPAGSQRIYASGNYEIHEVPHDEGICKDYFAESMAVACQNISGLIIRTEFSRNLTVLEELINLTPLSNVEVEPYTFEERLPVQRALDTLHNYKKDGPHVLFQRHAKASPTFRYSFADESNGVFEFLPTTCTLSLYSRAHTHLLEKSAPFGEVSDAQFIYR